VITIHDELPTGTYSPLYESEFYRLLPRKRQLYEENRTLRYGLRILLWSRYSRRWYERVINEETLDETLAYYFFMGLVRIYPTEENKEEIREDVTKSGLGYKTLMYRRQQEMEWERKKNTGNDGNGWRYWLNFRRKEIDRLKIKKKQL